MALYDPMQSVPTTVEQVKTALYYGKDPETGEILVSLFKVLMLQGMSLLEAYEETLLTHLGRSKRAVK